MSKAAPDTIPDAYATESLADAYRRGWDHGHGLACHNVPTLGTQIWTDDLGRVTVDADNVRDVHQSLCYAAESNSRSYSPFEFTAHEFNSAGEGGFQVWESGEQIGDTYATREEAEATTTENDADPDSIVEVPPAGELWEAFEAGVSDAIMADLAGYTDSDYGIEDDESEDDESEDDESEDDESTDAGELNMDAIASIGRNWPV